jgi:hypothetical protein
MTVHSQKPEESLSYSSVITVPFWIEVKKENGHYFPIILKKSENLIHPINNEHIFDKGMNSKDFDSEMFDVNINTSEKFMEKIGSSIMFKLEISSNSNQSTTELQMFNAFVRNTVLSYPRNFRSTFIKVMLPEIKIKRKENCNGENVSIIPFVIRRGGFENKEFLIEKKTKEMREYILFIELIMMGKEEIIKDLIQGIGKYSEKELSYLVIGYSEFYSLNSDSDFNATSLANTIIKSILSRIRKENRITLTDINEKLHYDRIVGTTQIETMETFIKNSKGYLGRDDRLSSGISPLANGDFLFINEFEREFKFIVNKESSLCGPTRLVALRSSSSLFSQIVFMKCSFISFPL